MKKFISLFFAALFLMSICASSALADGDTTNYAFTFTAQCVNTSSLNHASSYHTKQGDCTIIEVRHSVSGNGSSAGYSGCYCVQLLSHPHQCSTPLERGL